ncbi:MAG TPA: zinc ABC transporter substrate-binding protein, partial [Rhabdochlamydiaceae bacterium]
QLSAADIQKVIDHLFKYKIHVVFPESNVNKDSLKKIVNACREKGQIIEISKSPLYGDAMGKDTYLEMIEHNVEVLYNAWK